jgi:urease accessory protein
VTWASAASIRFRAGIGGEPLLADMTASSELSFAPARWGATIVGSAAHPIDGDRLGLRVDVGVGCVSEIRSAAPTVARRGRARAGDERSGPGGSSLEIRANVARDAMLAWRPEPGVAGDGCDHRSDAVVVLASNARLLWRDEILLERRSDSPAGTWTSRLRVERDGWPVVCSELAVGPASPLWESPAVLEGARAVGLVVIVDPEPDIEDWYPARVTVGSATAVAMPLAGPGVQIVAWGDDLHDCRAALDRVVELVGTPSWALSRWRSSPVLDPVV